MRKEHAGSECLASLVPTRRVLTYTVLYSRNDFEVESYTPVEVEGVGELAEGL